MGREVPRYLRSELIHVRYCQCGNVIDPPTSKPIAVEVQQRIHKRMLAYDGMAVHPDIGFYGQSGNREWKQYATGRQLA